MVLPAVSLSLVDVSLTQLLYSLGGGCPPGAVLPRGLRSDGRRHLVQERPHLHGRRQGRCRRNCRGHVIAGDRAKIPGALRIPNCGYFERLWAFTTLDAFMTLFSFPIKANFRAFGCWAFRLLAKEYNPFYAHCGS